MVEAKELRSTVAIVCIAAIGIAKLIKDGDGSVLLTCITAIGTLAGVEIGIAAAGK